MPYSADWGNTPAYRNYVETHGSHEGFVADNGCPQEPVNSIMWRLLDIGVSKITEKNISEVYARLKFVEINHYDGVWGKRYIGSRGADADYSLAVNWEDYTLTPEMVAQALHLHTNNSSLSRRDWVGRVVEVIGKSAYQEEARARYFNKSLTPTKCINNALDGFKLEYESSVKVLAHNV